MTWSNDCKVAFKVNADALLKKGVDKQKSVRSVCSQLADESGISLRTLQRWYKEQECDKTVANSTEDGERWPRCSECNTNRVEKNGHTGKPNGDGLCRGCRLKIKKEKAIQKAKEEFEQVPINSEVR
jgi:transposase-like protein